MSETVRQKSILIVDDDEVLRTRLERAFSQRGLKVYTAADCDAAIAQTKSQDLDMAVVDLKMPGKSGLELLREIHRISPETRIVMLTGYGSITNAVEAIKLGAVNYVAKPVDADELLSAFGKQPQVPDEELQPMSLASAQWEHIQRVLADCDGNISEAARRLDIPRRTLQRKLKKNAP
jgi:two-component system response regulator RegA